MSIFSRLIETEVKGKRGKTSHKGAQVDQRCMMRAAYVECKLGETYKGVPIYAKKNEAGVWVPDGVPRGKWGPVTDAK